MTRSPLPLTLPLLCLLACGDDKDAPRQGTLRIEARIEPESVAFDTSDGWSVELERVALTVRDVKLAGLSLPDARELDFGASASDALLVGEGAVESGLHTDAAYTVEQLLVRGKAGKEGVEKRFDWTLEHAARFVRCANQTRVKPDETTTLTLTVQPAQLFRNSLISAEPTLLFQAVADADRNDDGQVEGDELWEVPPVRGYDSGGAPGISTLWEYMEALVKRVGHVDGDVQCEVERR